MNTMPTVPYCMTLVFVLVLGLFQLFQNPRNPQSIIVYFFKSSKCLILLNRHPHSLVEHEIQTP